MAIKLQIRRDTLANWTSNQTVVLLTGEIGYVTDTRNMKIGDGTTQWQYLKYQAPYYTGTNSSLLTTTLSVDQTNNRVGIGTTTPQGPLQVAGSILYGTSGASHLIGSDGSNNAVSNAFAGHVFQVAASEKVRILSSGNVGIGTNNPASPLHIEGSSPAVRLKDTTAANTAYSLIDGNSDDGSITISADPTAQGAAASTVSLAVDGTTRFQATTTGVAITGTASTSGLLTANGGLTVPTGQALTVAGSGTVSVPSGSITGVAITANTLAPSKITNLAAAGVLGATGAGAVTALTSGLGGTAQTALGLGSNAYLAGIVISSSTSWVDLAVSATGTVNKNFNVSDLVIGQPTLIPLQFARASNSAVLNANLVLTSTDIVTVISASDAGTSNTSWGTTAASNQCAWWRRNTAIAGDLDYPGPITLSGTQTFLVFKWYQVSGNNTNGPRAYVYVVRQQ